MSNEATARALVEDATYGVATGVSSSPTSGPMRLQINTAALTAAIAAALAAAEARGRAAMLRDVLAVMAFKYPCQRSNEPGACLHTGNEDAWPICLYTAIRALGGGATGGA